jgi:hypothetical protein
MSESYNKDALADLLLEPDELGDVVENLAEVAARFTARREFKSHCATVAVAQEKCLRG